MSGIDRDRWEDELSAGLRALAETSRGAEAPAHVEARLMEAVAARRQLSSQRWLAVAAGVTLLITASWSLLRTKPQPAPKRPPPAEYVTEFLPVPYGTTAAPLDGGYVVRVRMPRSALVMLGMPVGGGPVQERVEADLVVGYDGVARAVRLVR